MNNGIYSDKEFCIEVWGARACFTRPEFKVERVSYEVITPSAARAIFECIFWKPAIQWEVTRIDVLNPIKWATIRRNEIKLGQNNNNAPIIIEDARDQRNSLILKDVRYRLYARFKFIPQWKRKTTKNPIIDKEELDLLHKDENPGKYMAIFERRARKGQCFKTPYLGCREFSADWKYIANPQNDKIEDRCIGDKDLGFMFYDWTYESEDKNEAQFFHAKMENGTILVPDKNNKTEVLR